MRRASAVFIRGTWSLAAANARVTLDHHDRHRRRVQMTTDSGETFLLDLPRPVQLAEGDGLKCDDGTFILVSAKAEPCLRLRADAPATLARIAWAIGNRHAPIQVLADALITPADPVLAEMAAGLGAEVEMVDLPFEPDPGAYHGTAGHGHDHGHHH
ncbi:MAG: Urease accessory protein UreE [Alphaproteobacteria bacterium]|nr:Urease accessory protein UreE [Alphaproteobacteria bacterium]TAD89544.1 MAG: Urease accessory protein UreE [Alphaproteobacteria bacterium]